MRDPKFPVPIKVKMVAGKTIICETVDCKSLDPSQLESEITGVIVPFPMAVYFAEEFTQFAKAEAEFLDTRDAEKRVEEVSGVPASKATLDKDGIAVATLRLSKENSPALVKITSVPESSTLPEEVWWIDMVGECILVLPVESHPDMWAVAEDVVSESDMVRGIPKRHTEVVRYEQ